MCVTVSSKVKADLKVKHETATGGCKPPRRPISAKKLPPLTDSQILSGAGGVSALRQVIFYGVRSKPGKHMWHFSVNPDAHSTVSMRNAWWGSEEQESWCWCPVRWAKVALFSISPCCHQKGLIRVLDAILNVDKPDVTLAALSFSRWSLWSYLTCQPALWGHLASVLASSPWQWTGVAWWQWMSYSTVNSWSLWTCRWPTRCLFCPVVVAFNPVLPSWVFWCMINTIFAVHGDVGYRERVKQIWAILKFRIVHFNLAVPCMMHFEAAEIYQICKSRSWKWIVNNCCFLSLQHNSIEMVQLRESLSLLRLDLSHNSLTSVHGLDGCTNLRYLKVSHNRITRIGM